MLPKPVSAPLLAALLLTGAFSGGCKKTDHPTTTPATFSATLADTTYQPTGQYIGFSYIPADTGFTIAGQTPGSQTQLVLSFHQPFTLNNPISTLTTDALVSFEVSTFDPPEVFLARGCCQGHAAITVTAWDQKARTFTGTFSGVLYLETDSLVVTNGAFSGNYPPN